METLQSQVPVDPEGDITAIATDAAARFGVKPTIHPEDFIFRFMVEDAGSDRVTAVNRYFITGADSAVRLVQLVERFLKPEVARPSVLEFACGYGGVTRHLISPPNRFEIIPCDIHPGAIQFLSKEFGLNGIVSATDPESLDISRRFDVVFALSFLTHLPIRTWDRWLRKLFDLVADGGILIFTTHGFRPWRMLGGPPVSRHGFYFTPWSEQKDLPTEDYGVAITLPSYVLRHLAAVENAEVLLFEAEYWSGHQDVIVMRRGGIVPRKSADDIDAEDRNGSAEDLTAASKAVDELKRVISELRIENDALRASTSWRITNPLRTAKSWFKRPSR